MSVALVIVLLAAVAALAVLAWLGLQVKPGPLSPLERAGWVRQTVAVPDHLPPPVARFYRELYGDAVPVIDSAVISGRARLRIKGITFAARFRFIHEVGRSYRHQIEATWFGLPVVRVKERYVDGKARLELLFGASEGPQVDQGANLALWAEAIWFPAAWVTDPRVRWEGVDGETALLVVPYGDDEQTFVARFDPGTGMLRLLESMRYRGERSEEKTLWMNEATAWGTVSERTVVSDAEVTWFDERTPWAVFEVEEVVYNAGVA